MNYANRLFLRMTVLTLGLVMSAASPAADDIKEKRSALALVTDQIQQLRTAISKDHSQETNIQEQLKTAEVQLGELNQEISHVNRQAAIVNQQLQLIKQQRKMHMDTLQKQRTALAKQLLTANHLGQDQTVKIILNQQNPDTINRYLTYHRILTQSRMKLIQGIQKSVGEVNADLYAISQRETELKKLVAENEARLAQQKATQAERQQLLTQLSHDTQSKQQQIITLLENQKMLQAVLAKLQAQDEVTAQKPFNQLRHQLTWPISGPIIASYGSMLDVGERLSGVIIRATENTPVHAVYTGKVVFADWLRGFGLLVIINHGNGFMSLYARNHSLIAKVGDQVRQGESIATAGNTGGYTKSGLYFEIRENGVPVNPNAWCH